jgi:hypothetical protein
MAKSGVQKKSMSEGEAHLRELSHYASFLTRIIPVERPQTCSRQPRLAPQVSKHQVRTSDEKFVDVRNQACIGLTGRDEWGGGV